MSVEKAVTPRARRHVLERFDEWVARAADDTAVVCGDHALTYGELDERANRLAWALRDRGAGPDTVVGLAVRRGMDMAVAVLGVLKAGAAYLPVEPEYPDQRIASALGDSECHLMIAEDGVAKRLAEMGTHIETLSPAADSVADFPDHKPEQAAGGENLQYVIYTSGSTGRPKGIAMTQRPQVTLLDWCRERYASRAVALQYYPITADVASLELLMTWCTGGCVVIATERDRYDITAVARLIREHHITRILLPVVAMHQLARHAMDHPADVRTLCELITTGDRQTITPELRQMCELLSDAVLDDHYGSTEINVVTAPRLTPPARDWPDAPPIGTPIVDARVYVLDTNLMPVPRNVPGEIYVGGGPLARGYLSRGALTASSFRPDPFAGAPGARMYRTGDMGRWRSGGVLEFLGRTDFQVKFRGYRIEPSEIETLLTARDDVQRAVVVLVRSDDDTDEPEGLLVAYVVPTPLAPGEVLHSEVLRDHLTAQLPAQMIPQVFVLLDELPLTETGKVDRLRLPRPDAVEPAYVAPRDELEATIAQVWADVLGQERVGVRHNFFWLGGHSLLVTRVTYELRDTLGVDLPLASMFERPTVESLAVEARRLLALPD